MSQDICLIQSAPARATALPPLALIAVILLAALVIAIISPAPQATYDTTQPAQIEDWHGNVMRSQ